MGLVYLPTFAIQINQMQVNIPYYVAGLVFFVAVGFFPLSFIKFPSPLRPKRKKRKLISRFSNQQTSKKKRTRQSKPQGERKGFSVKRGDVKGRRGQVCQGYWDVHGT